MFHTTASALNGVPSVNVTPWRSVIVIVLASFEKLYPVAAGLRRGAAGRSVAARGAAAAAAGGDREAQQQGRPPEAESPNRPRCAELHGGHPLAIQRM
jgi:hypothetical protein